MKLIDFRPPRIAMSLVLVAAALNWSLPAADGFRFAFPWVGAVLGAAGFSLMMWSWWLFKKNHVAICPTAETARLLTHAVYRFSRNPMYLGFLLMMLGLAVAIGTPPFYLACAAFFAIINWEFCPYEEAKLSRSFGQAYLEYKKQVRRWL